jgi:SAM-dependent methyltransferase
MAELGERLGRPRERRRMLDFGCGVGRMTRAFAAHFEHAEGLDVSAAMVERARALEPAVPNATFAVNAAPDLGRYDDGTFDLVWCVLVLQHVGDAGQAARYVGELLRVTAPGGVAIIQVPSAVPRRIRAHPRRHAYRALRALGVPPPVLFHRLGLWSMELTAVPEARVRALIDAHGGDLLGTLTTPRAGSPAIDDRTYLVGR